MSSVCQFVSPNADPVKQRAFFDAAKSRSVMYLARKVAELRAALAETEGAHGVLAEHVALGIVGEVALCERLTVEATALGRLVSEARAGNAAYDEFIEAARAKFATQTFQAARTELDGVCVEIPELEGKICGYERARAVHRERLVDAGLDDKQIDGGGLLKPDAEELAAWRRDLEAKREQIRRAKAFIASGPLFDLTLLDAGAHAA